MSRFFLELDLGQSQDPRAMATGEQVNTPGNDDRRYHPRYLQPDNVSVQAGSLAP